MRAGREERSINRKDRAFTRLFILDLCVLAILRSERGDYGAPILVKDHLTPDALSLRFLFFSSTSFWIEARVELEEGKEPPFPFY